MFYFVKLLIDGFIGTNKKQFICFNFYMVSRLKHAEICDELKKTLF